MLLTDADQLREALAIALRERDESRDNLRTVAERQREACAEAVKRFWGVGDHNAEVQACRATPLVTEGEP